MTRTGPSQHEIDWFPPLLAAVQATFAAATAEHPPLFTTTPPSALYMLWLDGFVDPEQRRIHTCAACRRFFERFGDVVTIDHEGRTRSALWPDANVPELYAPSVRRLREAVEAAPVSGVHLADSSTWGIPTQRDVKRDVTWDHVHVTGPAFSHPLLGADQKRAEAREERAMIVRALDAYPRDAVQQAVTLLSGEQLYRSEKVLGVATWLHDLHLSAMTMKHEQQRENLLWRAAATAPPGFAHVRATMIGTLLDDIVAGLPFEDVSRKFSEKMHPLKYQRPTAAPSDGNIAQAEAIVAKLGTAGALDRRFARLEDLELAWKPTPARTIERSGVFGHLRGSKEGDAKDIGGEITMTWEKFARTVLPTATKIELQTPQRGNFIALVTAANGDAPPIVQWDSDEQRNPVTWYVFPGGSDAKRFNLVGGALTAVTGITLLPPLWHGGKARHHGEGIILVLEAARDTQHEKSGGFFVEQLKSEYHSIRRTLESYMMNATIAGKNEATACGLDLRKGSAWDAHLRVTTGDVATRYKLDRWD